MPTLSVKAYLVTYDYGLRATVGDLDALRRRAVRQLRPAAGARPPQVEAGAAGAAAAGPGLALLRPHGKAPAYLRVAARGGVGQPAAAGAGAGAAQPCTEQELVLGICRR